MTDRTEREGLREWLNPGSPEAVSQGCICAVLDNGHGRGWMGGAKDRNGETLFVVTVGCPVHSPTEDLAGKGGDDDAR